MTNEKTETSVAMETATRILPCDGAAHSRNATCPADYRTAVAAAIEAAVEGERAEWKEINSQFAAAAIEHPPYKADLTATVERLQADLAAVKYAAHMPDDYEYGLPSWINQRLYACWIGADLSPAILAMLERELERVQAAGIVEGRREAFGEVEQWGIENDEPEARYAAQKLRARTGKEQGE